MSVGVQFQRNNVDINRETHWVFIDTAVINTDQSGLRRSGSYLTDTCGSQSVTDGRQGRNLKEKPWRSIACWLAQAHAQLAFLYSLGPSALRTDCTQHAVLAGLELICRANWLQMHRDPSAPAPKCCNWRCAPPRPSFIDLLKFFPPNFFFRLSLSTELLLMSWTGFFALLIWFWSCFSTQGCLV